MRAALFVAALVLSAGCILNEDKPILKFVCPGGQLVDDPGLCPREEATTTTTPPETTTTLEPTTTSTTESTTTSTTQPPTSTTLCPEQAIRGVLQVNDVDDRCHGGYGFRVNPYVWDCKTTGRVSDCRIGFWVTTPDGDITSTVTRQTGAGGLGFEAGDMKVGLTCISKDTVTGAYSALLTFS